MSCILFESNILRMSRTSLIRPRCVDLKLFSDAPKESKSSFLRSLENFLDPMDIFWSSILCLVQIWGPTLFLPFREPLCTELNKKASNSVILCHIAVSNHTLGYIIIIIAENDHEKTNFRFWGRDDDKSNFIFIIICEYNNRNRFKCHSVTQLYPELFTN